MIQLLHKFKKDFSDFLTKGNTSWWVEIITSSPRCIYYFGPFEDRTEALIACPGYVEDLDNEAALGIEVNIKRCSPNVLTVFNEEEELS